MDNELYINTPLQCVQVAVHGICDGNQEDVIKECTHNTLQCALLEDLTLGGQGELGWTGEKEWGPMWC